jgi:hypothetical protein
MSLEQGEQHQKTTVSKLCGTDGLSYPGSALGHSWIEPQILVAGNVDYRHPVVIVAVIAFGTVVRIEELLHPGLVLSCDPRAQRKQQLAIAYFEAERLLRFSSFLPPIERICRNQTPARHQGIAECTFVSLLFLTGR